MSPTDADGAPPARGFTPREGEILGLLAQGLTNAEIAGRLGLGLSSIKACVRQIFGKLGVHHRREAVARARELGLQGRAAAAPGGRGAGLPVPLSSFIGREKEKAALLELLGAAPVRVLTLTGPAGCGKTRLALEAAREAAPAFQGRAWWIDLAPLTHTALVPQAAAAALNLREQPGRPIEETLAEHLRPAPALLVLDNCEHLLAACAGLAQALLTACPGVNLLATSREALAIGGETAWPVPPMSLPTSERMPIETLLESEAVRLFAERARAVLPTFSLNEQNAAPVARLCRRLDGIPLAIELAAARINVLAAAQIAERLDDALGLLTRGAPLAAQRHASLRAALDWSHALLSAPEQALFRRLSAFSGGFSLEAAEAVCAGAPLEPKQILDLLSSLVEHSLLEVESPASGTRRFRLLEIIQQYADEKLRAAGEFSALRDRHLTYFLKLAQQAEPELFGPQQAAWTSRLEEERGNLRAALGWSLSEPGRLEAGAQVASALTQFWQLRGDFAEALAWLDRFLGRSAEAQPPMRAHLLGHKGFLTFHWRSGDEAQPLVEQAAALFREAGDEGGLGQQLHMLAQVALRRGAFAEAADYARQALEIHRAAGDRFWISACLFALGDGAFLQGEVERATECYQESLALSQAIGHAFATARRLIRLGQAAGARGQASQARAYLIDGLSLARQAGDQWGVTMALAALGGLALAQGQPERAARLLGAAQARLDAFGAHFWPLDRREYDRAMDGLHARLKPEAVKINSDEGRALSLEQAVAYALEAPAVEEQPAAARGGPARHPAGLTAREAEILALIAAGESNQAIADELVLSVRTVERHTANIYQKIGVSGPAARTAAANFAFRHGVGAPLTWPAATPRPEDT